MNNKFKKILSVLLGFVICFSAGANSVYASEISDSMSTNEVNASIEKNQLAPRSVGTAAVKNAIKWALRHSDDLVKSAARWIGDDAAKVVEKNFAKATPVLNQLLKYDTLVWQTVQDQLTHVVGRQAAIWIRMALEWLL
ncbi:hypothetical protein GCM10007377_03440 [Galliscardovia ingluviei]|uniref:Secreted protein n=1 Tax=Galliscardovia ingluviei TaxID=1769422 RepID=A0A8J3EXJ7_9BIFI|nr:hypothetical protein [Galliscardovia ingluviei]GGI12934.1 hypothetical protein GCM10007377_03440 [Galliscardovia ingluviei]